MGQYVADAAIYGIFDNMVKENFQPRIMGNFPKFTFARYFMVYPSFFTLNSIWEYVLRSLVLNWASVLYMLNFLCI